MCVTTPTTGGMRRFGLAANHALSRSSSLTIRCGRGRKVFGHQLAVALGADAQAAAVQFDEIGPQPMHKGGVEPDENVLLQEVPRSTRGDARGHISRGGLERGKYRRDRP